MRIAFFSDNFYPELSGISDSIILLAQQLVRQGHAIRFYVPRYTAREYRKINADVQELELGNGIDIVRLPTAFSYPSSTGQSRVIIPLGWALRSLRRWRPDIIHVQQFYGAGLEAVLASRLLRVPLIGTVHESPSEFVHNSPIRGRAGEWFLRAYSSWFYNRCRYVTAPSSFLFPEMISHGLHRPHRALSNPIDVERFRPDAQQRTLFRERFGITGPMVLYAGRLAPEKHVDICLQAFARIRTQVPDAVFLISGSGVSAQQLQTLAQDLSIEQSVRFLGYLTPSELVSAYQAADVFVVASTAEMQCLSMMQAMACQLPIVAVNAGGLPEYVPSGGGYVVPPNDVAAFAEALKNLLVDPELRQRYGAVALAHVQQFRPAGIASQWLELYEQTIQSARIS